jgi:hypothetical protein
LFTGVLSLSQLELHSDPPQLTSVPVPDPRIALQDLHSPGNRLQYRFGLACTLCGKDGLRGWSACHHERSKMQVVSEHGRSSAEFPNGYGRRSNECFVRFSYHIGQLEGMTVTLEILPTGSDFRVPSRHHVFVLRKASRREVRWRSRSGQRKDQKGCEGANEPPRSGRRAEYRTGTQAANQHREQSPRRRLTVNAAPIAPIRSGRGALTKGDAKAGSLAGRA